MYYRGTPEGYQEPRDERDDATKKMEEDSGDRTTQASGNGSAETMTVNVSQVLAVICPSIHVLGDRLSNHRPVYFLTF